MSTKIIAFDDVYAEISINDNTNYTFDVTSFRLSASVNSIPTCQINLPVGDKLSQVGDHRDNILLLYSDEVNPAALVGKKIKLYVSYYTGYDVYDRDSSVQGAIIREDPVTYFSDLLIFEGVINSAVERDSVSVSTVTISCSHVSSWLSFTTLLAANLPAGISWEIAKIRTVMGSKFTISQFLPPQGGLVKNFPISGIIDVLLNMLKKADSFSSNQLDCINAQISYGKQLPIVEELLNRVKDVNPKVDFTGDWVQYESLIANFYEKFPAAKVYMQSAWNFIMQLLPSFYLQLCPLSDRFVIEPVDTFTKSENLLWVSSKDIVLVDRQKKMNISTRGVIARFRPYNPIAPKQQPSFICYVKPESTGTLANVRLPAWMRNIDFTSKNQVPRLTVQPSDKPVHFAVQTNWEDLAEFLYLDNLFKQNSVSITLPFNHIFRPGMNVGVLDESHAVGLQGLRGRVAEVVWDWSAMSDSPNASTTLHLDSVHYDKSEFVKPNPLYVTDQYDNLEIYARNR